ncbi:ankyrin repeat domain-containing protein [Magnetospira sp. QH-2]|uniref:ankyrin repeat domain-containing protein n=1 Tax=Magnetospira sp. (strain QH-2) TaxID=1288970 RepID=UPI0003E80E18|nr:ankyrin repeat domain-containing protein [Magnetospira sp. QH-2]CCQ74393.1 Exported protein of unknown function [Magnetospira sp. QH-2]
MLLFWRIARGIRILALLLLTAGTAAAQSPPPEPNSLGLGPDAQPIMQLIRAIVENDLELARTALRRGADPAMKDVRGLTPLDIARLLKRPKIAELIAKAQKGDKGPLKEALVLEPEKPIPENQPVLPGVEAYLEQLPDDVLSDHIPEVPDPPSPTPTIKTPPEVKSVSQPTAANAAPMAGSPPEKPVVAPPAPAPKTMEPVAETVADALSGVMLEASPVVPALPAPAIDIPLSEMEPTIPHTRAVATAPVASAPVPALPVPMSQEASSQGVPGEILEEVPDPIGIVSVPPPQVHKAPAPEKPRPVPPKRIKTGPILQGVTLGLGSLTLGQERSIPPSCIQRQEILFCLEDSKWKGGTADLFNVTEIPLLQGQRVLVRYATNRVVAMHSFFPSANFDAVRAYFSRRHGPPTNSDRRTIRFTGYPFTENNMVAWRHRPLNGGPEEILQIVEHAPRRSLGVLPDHGLVRIFRAKDDDKMGVLGLEDLQLLAARLAQGGSRNPGDPARAH